MAFDWDDHPIEDKKSATAFNWDDHPVDKTVDKPQISSLESGVRGAAQGASFGFADEATGALEAAKDWLSKDPKGFMENYQKHRDESRQAYKAAEQANPKTFLAGQFGGAVAPTFLTGGASIPALAAQGAVQGLGSSEADLSQGDVMGAARDTAIGGGIGGALGAIGEKVIGPALSKIPGKLNEVAENLAARSLGAERGSIKSLGIDKVRAAGRQALDEGVISPLASTEDLISRNEALQKGAGEEMSKVYKTLDEANASTFNPLDVASKIEEKTGDFWRSPINKGETKQLENTLETVLMRGDQNIPFSEAQRLKEELGKVANWKNTQNVTDKEKMARDAYGVVSSSIDEAAEKGSKAVGIEGLEDTLKNARSTYSKTKTADTLLENKLAREQGNKLFGLTDAAVAAGSIGAAPLTGGLSLATVAPFAIKKVADRYGTQTGAVLADNLSKIVQKAPQMLGKFAKPLQDAAARGGASLGATHFILQQTNPEYREMMLRSEEDRDQ